MTDQTDAHGERDALRAQVETLTREAHEVTLMLEESRLQVQDLTRERDALTAQFKNAGIVPYLERMSQLARERDEAQAKLNTEDIADERSFRIIAGLTEKLEAAEAEVETLMRQRDALLVRWNKASVLCEHPGLDLHENIAELKRERDEAHDFFRDYSLKAGDEYSRVARERDEAREALAVANEYGDDMKARFAEAEAQIAALRETKG